MARGRPLEFDPEVALEEAMQTFWDLGFERSNLSALLERTGLSKSSLYQTFGSKRELYALCLERYMTERMAPLSDALSTSESARRFIEGCVLSVAEETRGSRRGCFLMNAAEDNSGDEETAVQVKSCVRRLRAIFIKAVDRAKSEGDIDADVNSRDTASYIVATLSGLKMLVKAGESRQTVRRAGELATRAIFS